MTESLKESVEKMTRAILAVGAGRGFLVRTALEQPTFIVTAAHCLPHLPPAHPASFAEERTYFRLLGELGTDPSVAAEVVFVDPVADIAVLEQPDDQTFFEEADAFEALVCDRPRFRVRTHLRALPERGALFSQSGLWGSCEIVGLRGRRWLDIHAAAADGHAPGTSGSPIIASDGHAIGVISSSQLAPVVVGTVVVGRDTSDVSTHGTQDPMLGATLPRWVLAALSSSRRRARLRLY
jgi:hypothetical protein